MTFAKRLTAWATTYMIDLYNNRHTYYELGEDRSGGKFRRTVTNKQTGDKYVVTCNQKGRFRCSLARDAPRFGGKRCWHQVYTGVLCIHALLVCADRITRTKERKEQILICCHAMQACNKHWYRGSYGVQPPVVMQLQDPTKISQELVAERSSVPSLQREHTCMKQQFASLLSVCTKECVYEHLNLMRRVAVAPLTLKPCDDTRVTTLGNSSLPPGNDTGRNEEPLTLKPYDDTRVKTLVNSSLSPGSDTGRNDDSYQFDFNSPPTMQTTPFPLTPSGLLVGGSPRRVTPMESTSARQRTPESTCK